jgi:DNA replication and repair protein RecF
VIQSINLHSYRNLHGQVDLTDKNLLVAANGQGKTNLLESIYHTTTGHSFKTLASNHELIAENADVARIEIALEGKMHIAAVISAKDGVLQRTLYFNEKKTSQASISKRILPVLFAPHSVDIIGGDPQGRRNDLDIYLSATLPAYRQTLKSYNRVLKNRNALLKNIREGYSQLNELNYWDNQLLELAETLVSARLGFFERIDDSLHAAAGLIYNQKPKFELNYLSKHGNGTAETYLSHLREKMQSRVQLEVETGQTLYGPHKDDYELLLDGKALRYYGSRGQQRIAIFTLKFAQILFYKAEHADNEVIFLIDDLLSELDASHKQKLGEFLSEKVACQWILTSADEKDIPASLAGIQRLKLGKA